MHLLGTAMSQTLRQRRHSFPIIMKKMRGFQTMLHMRHPILDQEVLIMGNREQEIPPIAPATLTGLLIDNRHPHHGLVDHY
jgi:hypothetical protein